MRGRRRSGAITGIVWVGLLCAAAAHSRESEGRCRVNDPTATPLNVRGEPNGHILTTLSNGMRVEPLDETMHQTKRWLLVSRFGERLGWVFADYILCGENGHAAEAAPIPPAERR